MKIMTRKFVRPQKLTRYNIMRLLKKSNDFSFSQPVLMSPRSKTLTSNHQSQHFFFFLFLPILNKKHSYPCLLSSQKDKALRSHTRQESKLFANECCVLKNRLTVTAKEASKGSSWVTEESSDCSVTKSERFLPLSLLPSTLRLIILLQQSKLRNESNGNLGLCPLGRFFFPLYIKDHEK